MTDISNHDIGQHDMGQHGMGQHDVGQHDVGQHDAEPPAHRRQCPTCRAHRRDQPICPRCKSDLTNLIRIERQADALRARARGCYARGWYRAAAAMAVRVTSLEASPDDYRLAACAQLLSGDFAAAWNTRLRARRLFGE